MRNHYRRRGVVSHKSSLYSIGERERERERERKRVRQRERESERERERERARKREREREREKERERERDREHCKFGRLSKDRKFRGVVSQKLSLYSLDI